MYNALIAALRASQIDTLRNLAGLSRYFRQIDIARAAYAASNKDATVSRMAAKYLNSVGASLTEPDDNTPALAA